MIYTTTYKTIIGNISLASDGINLIGLWIEGQKYYLTSLTEKPMECDDLEIFTHTKLWLDRYIKGEIVSPNDLPLKPIGSEFRQKVWELLCRIPYGETITYGEIAKILAKADGKNIVSAQAVGGAVGHNPISIVIPCHRVVGANGNLTGYAGGIDKKVMLLTIEKIDMTNFYIPTKGTAL